MVTEYKPSAQQRRGNTTTARSVMRSSARSASKTWTRRRRAPRAGSDSSPFPPRSWSRRSGGSHTTSRSARSATLAPQSNSRSRSRHMPAAATSRRSPTSRSQCRRFAVAIERAASPARTSRGHPGRRSRPRPQVGRSGSADRRHGAQDLRVMGRGRRAGQCPSAIAERVSTQHRRAERHRRPRRPLRPRAARVEVRLDRAGPRSRPVDLEQDDRRAEDRRDQASCRLRRHRGDSRHAP